MKSTIQALSPFRFAGTPCSKGSCLSFLLGLSLMLFLILPRDSKAQESPFIEAPRVIAALQQGLAAERGIGIRRNAYLAIDLYCDAGMMGSPEAYFRIGRILTRGPPGLRNPRLANTYLALAASLGHHEALDLYNPAFSNAPGELICGEVFLQTGDGEFDMEGYISGLMPAKQKVAALIRKRALQYGVDVRLALAVALAESNLERHAVSPKNAQGIMQLIPETQVRFGVMNPFDLEQNIRGGLSYLRWLHIRFGGNPRLVAAAYNAGEGMVDRYSGVPPFPETQHYVRRVLRLSGMTRLN